MVFSGKHGYSAGHAKGTFMQTELTAPHNATLAPTLPDQRIEALDVVRGFALLGIFLMNIEFFNRETLGIGQGMALGLTGIDWWAAWFVAYFVQGKFWTIFSLLFGMGFAVMLTRAEQAGRDFMGPYLRRLTGLAVFGALHFIFLWSGDILFSYAVGAAGLLVLLYGTWKPILLALLVMIGIGMIPNMNPVFAVAGSLVFIGVLALYLRSERSIKIFGRAVPLFSFILLLIGGVTLIAALVLWVLPSAPKDARIPTTVMGVLLLALALLSAKYHQPVALRELRLGVSIYVVSFLMMTLGGAAQYLKPPEAEAAAPSTMVTPTSSAAANLPSAAPVALAASGPAASAAPPSRPASASANKADEKTAAQKAAERKAERAKQLAQREERARDEVRILSSGSYLEAVDIRARRFPQKVVGDAGFGTVLVAMFLIGCWFVRSGVMQDTRAHLPLFRKLALYGLPFGIGLGLLGSLISVSSVPGAERDGFMLALGLAMLGNLPACLGYVGMVVLMLHSNSGLAKIRVLAPLGRMALTTYLMQSVICTFYFYGYGLGHWGMGRTWQLVFVIFVLALQLAFSHWWLARYRFGPVEWLWRALTYRQTPTMRR
jgi:uncharacterized membrane protein YeiB